MIDIRRILAIPAVYKLSRQIVWSPQKFSGYVDTFIKPRTGERMLDIGCGTADIVDYLHNVDYLGIDTSQVYIDLATKRFGHRARFRCSSATGNPIEGEGRFDIVLAQGVLHHLNDDDAKALLRLAQGALKPGGRLITLDGCYTNGQPWIAKYLLSKDRGKHVRPPEEYVKLACGYFSNIGTSIREDLLRFPYTLVIMECSN
jgi:SAM-dependent methyltransferase